jgi:hypothetical protein
MQTNKKIFYKDHVVRCRLRRRRRRRRSRPPTEAILKENHRKNLDANLKACSRSRSHRNKRNNICKTSTRHPQQKPYYRVHITESILQSPYYKRTIEMIWMQICCKMKVCSRSHRNKTIISVRLLQRPHIVYPWIQLYFGISNRCYSMTGVMQTNKKYFIKTM